MAPMAPTDAFDQGVKSGDQQSYLQQVLNNTRAEQNNAAQIKAKQDQRTFDPSVFEDPSLPPEEHAARKRDALSFAQGAQPGPDGRPLAIYKSADELKNMLDFVKTQAGQRASVQGDKNLADATEQNLQPNQIGADGKPDPLIAKHLNVLRGTNPLDPNRGESRKIISDLGLYKAQVPLGGQAVDTTGAPIGRPNLPGAGSGGSDMVTPDSPEGIKRRRAGQQYEEKTVIGPNGLPTKTYDWKDRDQSQLTRGDVLSMLVDEKSPNFPPGSSLDNLSESQQATLSRRMLAEQAKTKVGTALTINSGKLDQAANGPLKPKELADFFNPQTKTFAVNDPAMRGADPTRLQQAGYLHTSAWGTSKDMVAEIQNVNTADAHLGNIRQFIDRNPDLYPNFDAQHPLSGAAAAHVQQVWRGILDGSDPRIAELKALDRSSLNILAAIAPPKNMRSGYSLLRYASEGLVNPSAVMSHQGALANIQGWENSVKAAAKGRLTAVDRSGAQVPTDIDRANTTPTAPSAGASGTSPFLQWKASQGGTK